MARSIQASHSTTASPYRVPDQGYRRDQEPRTWVLIVDPETRHVTWLRRVSSGYAEADGSALLAITTANLAA